MEDNYIFEQQYAFENMYFGIENKIKLSEIYKQIKNLNNNYDNEIVIKWINEYDLSINLKRDEEECFDLDIIDKRANIISSRQLLIYPSKLYYNLDYNRQIELDIVSLEQFENIPKFLDINDDEHRLLLYCTKESKVEYGLFGNYVKHLKCGCKIIIYQTNSNLITLQEEEFNQIFKKKFPKDLKFKDPNEFDKNYSYYFNFYKTNEQRINDEFKYYPLINRNILNKNLKSNKYLNNNLYFLFGKTGMGKSITIIKTLKYDYNHKKIGTIYFNCKSMYKNYRQNFDLLKQILKDEIPFLFENEYNKYQECIHIINKFQKNNMNTFWDLINYIIELCKHKDKSYIFAFDQYKDEFDQNGQLFKLNDKLKNKNKFGILVCCSMNDKDIREYKISKLFNEANLKYHPDNMKIEEVELELNSNIFNIDEGGEFDQAFNKVGKTIKNFNELSEIKLNNSENLREYLESKKERIKNNLIYFYKIKESTEFTDTYNIQNLLSFSGETEYELNYVNSIKKNIPFKYFDIQIINQNSAKIKYNFDLVKEVVGELYEYLIYNHPNIYQIFNLNKLDNGALGGMYEKFVIYHMSPDISKKIDKRLFNHFTISKTYSVQKFIPNDNENWEKVQFDIKTLENGTYLFTQKNFNGKAFDAAIIDIKTDNKAIIYLLQISINKHDIFSIDELKENIILFKNYFKRQFSFIIKKKNIYFTYIFHSMNKSELLNNCTNNKMKCIFFNPSQKIFIDKNDFDLNNLCNLEEIFISPFRQKETNDI